jgi:Dolichyl-phosphate-mannose-protein mannosyltransferase
MLSLVVAAVALAAAATILASCLRPASGAWFLLAAYLLAAAAIVVLAEVLSLAGRLGRTGLAVGEAAVLVGSVAVWIGRGRPAPPLPRRLPSVRAHPFLALLALCVAAGIAYELFIGLATPPHTWDSMTYHLPRAVEWLQRGAIEYVPGAHTARMNALQPNGEVLVAYTLAFVGHDRAVATPQFVAQLALLVSVFGIARRLGFRDAAAFFAALLTATLTQIALQSMTTQNDLVAASFVAAAAYFALGSTTADLALMGLAVGLALGTKATTALALPVLVLVRFAAAGRTRAAALGAALAVGFAAVGAYGYVLNLVETGHPLGDDPDVRAQRPDVTATGTISTAARLAFRFADLSGLPELEPVAVKGADVGRSAFEVLHIPPNPPEATRRQFSFVVNILADEDVSFFGLLGAVLLVPLSAGFLVAGAAGRAPPKTVVFATALPLYLILLSLSYRYNAWVGRFMITPVALTMPLAAALYRWRLAAAAAGVLGVVTLSASLAQNAAKPSGTGGRAVWAMTRAEAQSIKRPAMRHAIDGIERWVPEPEFVGTVFGRDDWVYPVYGKRLGRRLVPLPRRDPLTAADGIGLRWVVVSDVALVAPRQGWGAVSLGESRWTLFVRESG